MLNISLLALTLCAGTLVEPFRIVEAEPGHHQVRVRAAMAPDGHFAIAWTDYLQLDRWRYELDLYIRFFDPDGSPLTDPYKITKMVDTNWICGTHLDMDSAGNTVLIWTEVYSWNFDEDLLRLQLFDTSSNPLGSHQTDHQGEMNASNRAVAVSLNDQVEFAIAWDTGGAICARRYSFEGGPQGDPFVVHGDLPDDVSFYYPGVALSDAGDLVVTWHEFHRDGDNYPKFQVFDAEDESILPWEPMGHLVPDDSLGGTRVEPYWLDNDRFVLFWIDYFPPPWHIAGRVFADRGLTRYPICRLVRDSLAGTWADPEGQFAIALSSDERFAETHTRGYTDHPDTSDPSRKRRWQHGGGILGYIQDNEPMRRTTLFEYTPPLGADTVNSYFDNWTHFQFPAVGVCDSLIVWVYSRFNTDTIFEAYAMITDWDMGEGVTESPIHTVSPIQLGASLNRLSYDVQGEAKLTLYSADGRRVLQETIQGKGIWTPPSSASSSPSSLLPSGVYFARVEYPSAKATAKLVILH
jgi:hypothetical protein